jgi:hypothetical protein
MDGISLVDAPHKEKDFSLHHLSGAYRYLVQRPKDLTWRLLSYSDPNEDLAATDLDLAAGKPGPNVSVVEEGAGRQSFKPLLILWCASYARLSHGQWGDVSTRRKLNVC